MSTTETLQDAPDPRRPIDRWLFSYSGDHQHPTNQLIHVICVPTIVWSVTALMWTIPVPSAYLQPGTWMAVGMFFAWLYYWKLSKPLAFGMLATFVAFGVINRLLWLQFGIPGLLWIAIGVFVVAWIGQFIGHRIEGRKPSFFTDLSYLLIGPLWTLDKLYRRLGWGH
ncbi:DUF962 domain-containing protein [Arenimonas composti]|uniref:DUF962 domain-containing protein n=1 Tax=Arenimonas composti TR7-09 = DSM 18010 TaxID=1121013 RepID=A0A091BI01_9GAMM|nr:Mpo1-like protein [Arenimonas composti]KFN51381.1 hypothetical protein P873_03690 [Arenimonas composti TR7-09 = DSM 18010]